MQVQTEHKKTEAKVEPRDESSGVKYVEWRDVLTIGPFLLYGDSMVGKSRFAMAVIKQLLNEKKKVLYIITEPNMKPLLSQIRNVLNGASIEYMDNPYDVREYARLLWVRRRVLTYDFIVLDSLAGIRESYALLYGSGKLRDIYEANRITTEVVWGIANYANTLGIPALIITHETPAINRNCYGKDACPTASKHAMYAMSGVMYMYKELRKEDGEYVERVIEVVEHRYAPSLVGCRVKLLEPPM